MYTRKYLGFRQNPRWKVPKEKGEREDKREGEGEIDLHSIGSHKDSSTVLREREREREREMIADAFFAFLSWLRLLFFNREMELALIGTTLTT